MVVGLLPVCGVQCSRAHTHIKVLQCLVTAYFLWRSEWSDAVEEDERLPSIHCLFCVEVNREWAAMEDHMKVSIVCCITV